MKIAVVTDIASGISDKELNKYDNLRLIDIPYILIIKNIENVISKEESSLKR